MSEPAAAAPAERPVDQLTPEEAGAEVRQIRGNRDHPFHHEGRPGFDAALERVTRLSERAHASTDHDGEPGAASPDAAAPRPNVFDEPHPTPETAAELDAVPPPELSPAVVKAGFQWDDGMLRAVNAVADREGVTGLVLDVRHEVARALSDGPTDFATLERQLEQRWGRAYQAKLEAALLALDELPPAVRANLEQYALDVHPGVLDKLARVGEALMDPTTPGGERRLKAKYQQWADR